MVNVYKIIRGGGIYTSKKYGKIRYTGKYTFNNKIKCAFFYTFDDAKAWLDSELNHNRLPIINISQ